MNDDFIRRGFHQRVLQQRQSFKNALILDELGLCHGKWRADIAVINGSLIGYEIKSDKDSLDRLGEQVKAYNAVFDRSTIIVGSRYCKTVLSEVPDWWGIIVCIQKKRGGVQFDIQRRPKPNPSVDPLSVAKLLWRTEVIEILIGLGEPASLTRQSRSILYERLAGTIGLSELKRRVRENLRQRKNWRRPAQLSPDDD